MHLKFSISSNFITGNFITEKISYFIFTLYFFFYKFINKKYHKSRQLVKQCSNNKSKIERKIVYGVRKLLFVAPQIGLTRCYVLDSQNGDIIKTHDFPAMKTADEVVAFEEEGVNIRLLALDKKTPIFMAKINLLTGTVSNFRFFIRQKIFTPKFDIFIKIPLMKTSNSHPSTKFSTAA